ncbi:hypothetical protein CLCR_11229 [Cladophialophora carrionii]|uniref:Uncharacterized protein n=1 Tax=Cladophialophora carrionii TaxID=86049 RepID=A0A1C1C809_9EURO|nr:hypothetical protein CLCR_11229 [Cladophialophora carrionii]
MPHSAASVWQNCLRYGSPSDDAYREAVHTETTCIPRAGTVLLTAAFAPQLAHRNGRATAEDEIQRGTWI